MTLGPIPWTAMVLWCDRHGLDRDVANHLIAVVRLVDRETLRRLGEHKDDKRGRR